ncbi:hypothetical protein BDZ85DRAFT_207434 [Elsinoe ampelina]|uniref:Proteasome assembly chaperone 3 n=1 Tax=Elsinoe ampelina TaxID=302913 RepID=A0A6A6FZI1_9PEZI|nr:hypothetical protein BDZ85DRAFT_207434 [Elsinoe ampelina]
METASEPVETPYPAKSRTAVADIADISTSVTSVSFTDRILLTVAQSGRVSHWVHVPLARGAASEMLALSQPPTYSGEGPESSLLPLTQLTATTVLGGTKEEFEVVGQTLATTVASAILMRNGEERRTLVLGLGLAKADWGRSDFDGLVGLCLDVI